MEMLSIQYLQLTRQQKGLTLEPGAVARLATQDDVKHTDGTGATDAVVTANLLKATNDIVEGIVASAGGVVTVDPCKQ